MYYKKALCNSKTEADVLANDFVDRLSGNCKEPVYNFTLFYLFFFLFTLFLE